MAYPELHRSRPADTDRPQDLYQAYPDLSGSQAAEFRDPFAEADQSAAQGNSQNPYASDGLRPHKNRPLTETSQVMEPQTEIPAAQSKPVSAAKPVQTASGTVRQADTAAKPQAEGSQVRNIPAPQESAAPMRSMKMPADEKKAAAPPRRSSQGKNVRENPSSTRASSPSGKKPPRRSYKKVNRRRSALLLILLIFFIAVFVFSAVMLALTLIPRLQAHSEYLSLAPERLASNGTVSQPPNDTAAEAVSDDDSESVSITQELLDYYTSVNDDFIGWIDVPGTNIHYPVVIGTDNEYYLHHTFKLAYSDYGSIFADYNNARDFSDDNTVLYGHNMRNGSMFHDVNSMLASSEYAQAHSTFTITTPDGYRNTYQIFSIYRVSIETDYRTPNISNDNDRIQYFNRLQGYSAVSLPRVTFTSDSRIVTFSTCPRDSADDYRVAAHAVLISSEPIGQ